MAAHRSRVVLHVDDDPAMTRFIGHFLTRYGFETRAVNDPQLAIPELLRSEARVVLLDIDMPGINGLDLLRKIKECDGGVQVIMLTGIVNLTSVLDTLRSGAEACFFKPLQDITPLIEALNDTFRKLDRWVLTIQQLQQQRRAGAVLT